MSKAISVLAVLTVGLAMMFGFVLVAEAFHRPERPERERPERPLRWFDDLKDRWEEAQEEDAEENTEEDTDEDTGEEESVSSPIILPTVYPLGGAMPWCSSPLAPGWNVSLQGGGCFPYSIKYGLITPYFLDAGEYVIGNGQLIWCPLWMNTGCVIQ